MTKFLQFGTSRFLQAHADLFIGEALGENQITVVHSSGSPATLSRLDALQHKAGFPIIIKGLEGGQPVERLHQVYAVKSALSTTNDWDAVLDAGEHCEFIISNVSEKGYEPHITDAGIDFHTDNSFPVKLLHLLSHRFAAGAPPLCIMPLELFEANGYHLKKLVFKLARDRNKSSEFLEWLKRCIWVNSLVDRIVSEAIEPAGAVAEPYALWAIENANGLEFPLEHQNIKIVDDLRPYQYLKLYILNLSHSYMASKWQHSAQSGQLPEDFKVREYMDCPELFDDLVQMLESEVLPGFKAAGLLEQANVYMSETIDRFRNPSLNHFLRDIYGGHYQKVRSRIGGFVTWAKASGDDEFKPRLSELLEAERQSF